MSVNTWLLNQIWVLKYQRYVDRSETDLDNLLTDLNAEFRSNPNRGLLIKGSKNLPWKEAYKVMNTINEGGMSTMLLATERPKSE